MKKTWNLRILIGVGVPLGALLLASACFVLDNTPPCMFYEITGLLCPGCGTGRCMLSLLHLDFYAAFRYQPLLFVSLPFLFYYLLKIYIAFVFDKDVLPLPKIKNRAFGIAVTVIIISYWILRNIPVYPFTLLAPGAY